MAALPPLLTSSSSDVYSTGPTGDQTSSAAGAPPAPRSSSDRIESTRPHEQIDPLRQAAQQSAGAMAMVRTMAPRFMVPDMGAAASSLGGAAAAAAPVAASAAATAAVGAMGTDLANTMSRQPYANAAAATPPQSWTAGGRNEDQWRQHVLQASQDRSDPYDPRTFSRRQAVALPPDSSVSRSGAAGRAAQPQLIDRGSQAPFVTPIDRAPSTPLVSPIDSSTASPFTTPADSKHTSSTTSSPANQGAGIGAKLETPVVDSTASDHMLLAKTQPRVSGSDYQDETAKLNAKNTGPGKWVRVPGQSNSERAADYQQQISGVPFGNEYLVDGKKLDGIRTNGDGSHTFLEAKGPGFADKLKPDGRPQEWFQRGFDNVVKQTRDQADIAKDHSAQLEVHVAEKPFADALRTALTRASNVKVVFTPPQ